MSHQAENGQSGNNKTGKREQSGLSLSSDLPRAGTFPSVDLNDHANAQKATKPTPDPLAGQSLLDVEGEVKHISPHGINVHQFYPEVELEKIPETDGAQAVETRPDQTNVPQVQQEDTVNSIVLGTDSTAINIGSRQVTVSENQYPAVGGLTSGPTENKALAEVASPDDSHVCEEPLLEDKGKVHGKVEGNTAGDTDEATGVFSTAVDEETLQAAKKRQTTFIDVELPNLAPLPTMKDVLDERISQHLFKAEDLVSSKQYQKAIICYNKAINLRPRDTSMYIKRAELFLQICDIQSAILNYKYVCVLDPNNYQHYNRLAFIYYLQGQCLFDQRLYPEALEAFSRAAEMRPEVIGYHTRSIACLAALQRHGECLALVNKRLESENDNADLCILRARLHQLFRNTTLSYYDTKDTLAIDPDHREAQRLMKNLEGRAEELKQQATQLSLIGRHRDALQKISIAIETNPSVADFHVLRGALHRRLTDFNAAIDDYLLALDKTDHNEESPVYLESQRQLLLTYNDFAVECFTKGFYEEAILLLNKAIKGEKREKGLYINRGDCFFKEGNLQFALADYQQAQELDPNDSAIKVRIAVIHNEHGIQEYQDKNYSEADGRFTQAIEQNPLKGEYYISRCRVRQMMENLTAARQDIIVALHLDPSNAEIISLMSRLFPGKTVKDLMQSRAGVQARAAIEQLMLKAGSSGQLQGLQDASSSQAAPPIADPEDRVQSSAAQGEEEADEALPPVAGSLWKPGGCFPNLRTCMQEKQFHIKIVDEKKRINDQIKDALHNRKTLKYDGGRVSSMPDISALKVKSTKSKSTALTPGVKAAGGWRNFGVGVGVPAAK